MDRDFVASDYSCNTSRTQSLSEGVAYFLRLTVLGVWYFLLLTLSLSLSPLRKRSTSITRNSIINVINKSIYRDITCFVHQVKQINNIQSEN